MYLNVSLINNIKCFKTKRTINLVLFFYLHS
uniref:Uncharacterized protein n=1 Tax=Firmicutes phage HS08 TaxID=3056391 RepID=A0AA49X3Z2_9VIRU|nr:MAG: hypothetical protein [Firmicutes phage HS08]